MVTPSRIFAPAPSQAPAPIVTPDERLPCARTGDGRIAEIVVAADHVAVRGQQRVPADA